MRTITGTDFSISAPDAYTFMFAPNILTVTLGTSYAADEVVTLSGNGLTFTRSAINRVVKFDMMPIFESKFPDTNFDITFFSTVDDPLYSAAFNCVVSVLGNTTNVPFSLRWGALQHDDYLTYTNYRFPFWVGKTIAINNHLEHTSWQHTSGGTFTGTVPKLIHLLPDAQFTYTVTNGSSSQVITYYPATCPDNGAFLRWVDAYGRVISYNFELHFNDGTIIDTQQSGDKQSYPINYEDTLKGRFLPTIKTKSRTFRCYATVDTDIFNIVASVVSSPIVFLLSGSRWIRVNITPTQVIPSKTWLSDIEFTVELPKDYVQRL